MSDEEKVPASSIAPFALRLQPRIKQALEAAAQAVGRSLNAEIAARLEQSLEAEDMIAQMAQQMVALRNHDQQTDELIGDLQNELAYFRMKVKPLEDLPRLFERLSARVELLWNEIPRGSGDIERRFALEDTERKRDEQSIGEFYASEEGQALKGQLDEFHRKRAKPQDSTADFLARMDEDRRAHREQQQEESRRNLEGIERNKAELEAQGKLKPLRSGPSSATPTAGKSQRKPRKDSGK